MQQIKAAVLTPRSKYSEKDVDWVLCCQWLCQNLPSNHKFSDSLLFRKESNRGSNRQSFLAPPGFLSCLVKAAIYKAVVEETLPFSIDCGIDIDDDEFTVTFFTTLLDTLAENGICLPSIDAALLSRNQIDLESHCALTKAIMQINMRSIFSNDMVPNFRSNISQQGSLVSWADVECTLTSWLNEIIKQVNEYVKRNPVSSKDDPLLRVEGVTSSLDLSSSGSHVRSRWECPVPLVDDIYQDISDGQCLAAIFAFYFPHLLTPHEIRVKSLMGFSDCLHNLSIVIHFCTTDALVHYCPDISKLWLLSTEEIIYSNWTLRAHVINALVLLYVNLRSLPLSETLMHKGTTTLVDHNSKNDVTSKQSNYTDLSHGVTSDEGNLIDRRFERDCDDGETRSNSNNSNDNLKETSSMCSRYSSRRNSSLDPAGDALVELEARWRPKSSSSNQQLEPHREKSHHDDTTIAEIEPRNTLPKYKNCNQSSNFDRVSVRSGRDPSEDSAIGTLSTNSEAGYSHNSDVPRRRPKQSQVVDDRPISRPCSFTVDIASSPGSSEMAESNYNKTYSRKTSRSGQQRMSIQNILDSPLGSGMEPAGTVKPLSAMKNENPVSNFPPKPSRTGNPFVQSQQPQTKCRPKSAIGERVNSQVMLYSEDSDEEPISEPESVMGRKSSLPHGATSNGKMNAIKMKMEEKRKNIQIERARLEAARQKQRQKMSKTAFMRVMRNPDSDKSGLEDYGSAHAVSDDERSLTDQSLTDATFGDNRARRTMSEKITNNERRGRAKSIHLENFDPNAPDRVSRQMQDVQTSTNFSRQHSEQQKHPGRFSSRPNSVHERDIRGMRDFEWSGGLESNQNTLKRNKPVQMRPLTRLSDSEYSEFDQRPLTIPNYASSSVDLRNSLERDMLIEQNHLLARELETLKQRFAVELETRKLQSEREQFELQRQMESQHHSNPMQPLHNQPHQTSHVAPPYWTMPGPGTSGAGVPGMQQANQKVPLSHNAANFMYGGATHNQYPHAHVNTNGTASPYMSGTSHLANQKPPLHQPVPFYPYQSLQPPYATQDQEMYQHYETTHRQEYNYDTLHGTHHSYYQQSPYQVPPAQQGPVNVPPAPVQNHAGLYDLPDSKSRSYHEGLTNEALHGDFGAIQNHPNDMQHNRPTTLPVVPKAQSLQKSDSLESELCTLLSPMDPNAEVSSSVEVTPENSPAHEHKYKSASSNVNPRSPKTVKSDLAEEKPKETVQPSNRLHSRNNNVEDHADNSDAGRASKKGEAFSIDFGNAGGKSPRIEAVLGKASPKLPRKLAANNNSRTMTKVKGRQDNKKPDDVPTHDTSRSNSRLSSHSGANNLDEALKIVRDTGANESKEQAAEKRKSALALVIDVEALGNNENDGESSLRKDGEADEAKRKEREQEFLRRQMEKKQKDLERRKKATEMANVEGQERLQKEMQQKQQMKQEAQARRERIMAQYLQRKAEKEMEENGMAPSNPKGSIGGGNRGGFMVIGGGSDIKSSGGVNGMKPRPKSRSKSTVPTDVKQSRPRAATQKSPSNVSRSRRNSVENLLSDGESIVSGADHWDGRSETSEYNGPKLFGKPSTKSNKQKIQNAITQCVFPGAVNSDMKQKILNEMEAGNEVGNAAGLVDTRHFLILFRDHSLKYRGLYLCEGDCSDGEISKVIGIGPSNVKLSMIQDLYKYDSGGKRFLQIPSKTMAVSVDAFTIHNQLWKKK